MGFDYVEMAARHSRNAADALERKMQHDAIEHIPVGPRRIHTEDDGSIWEIEKFPVLAKYSDTVIGYKYTWTLAQPPAFGPPVIGGRHINNGEVGRVQWEDSGGNIALDISGLDDIVLGDILDTSTGFASQDEEVRYEFFNSYLNGNVVVTGSSFDDSWLEVGTGGKATIRSRGGDDRLYVWHSKTVDFDGGSGIDTIDFNHSIGGSSGITPVNGAVIDLAAGTGTNPFGGTVTLDNVENVAGHSRAANTLRGDARANYLQGGFKADRLEGRGGNDQIGLATTFTGSRATFADGGSGTDTLTAPLSLTSVEPFHRNVLDLVTKSHNTGTFEGGTFLNFEIFRFGGEAYLSTDFRGTNKSEDVRTSTGNDFLNGRGGNDKLDGNLGDDRMTGGSGNDTFYASSTRDKAIESAGQGNDIVFSDASFTLGANVERLTLTGFLAIKGTGNAGSNTITGNIAANTLSGGGGNDSLKGGLGNDSLSGGAGRDTLAGGVGKDRLNGGASADKFLFNTAPNKTTNVDTVTDFSRTQGDKVVLDRSVFTALGSDVTAASFFKGTAAHDATDRILYNAATGRLSYDKDGDGSAVAVHFATIGRNLALTHLSFDTIA